MKLVVIENKELCGACKGSCCKHTPGLFLPNDFGKTIDEVYQNLKKEIIAGNVVLAGRPKDGSEFYIPSPATKARRDTSIFVTYNMGVCNNLTSDGCSLGDKRPGQCKAVIPELKGTSTIEDLRNGNYRDLNCHQPLDMTDVKIIKLWQEFQLVLDMIDEEANEGWVKETY